MRMSYVLLCFFYLWPSDHHQAGSHLPHHFVDQQGLAHPWGPHQEDTSGTGHTQWVQGAWVKQRQLQHLSQGGTHLKDSKKHM